MALGSPIPKNKGEDEVKILLHLLLFFFLLNSYLLSKEITPAFTLESRGLVSDFVLDGSKLYVANDEGSVEIFDFLSRKKVDEIFLAPINSLVDGLVPAKILSVDRHNSKTLIVSSAEDGYRNVWLHDGIKLKHLISTKRKIAVKEARFLDDKNFIFGTLGYDMVSYTMNDSHMVFNKHIEDSSFSDMVMSEDKTTMVTASESGQVMLLESKSGKLLKAFKPLNLDNIYKLAYQNGTVITAGQDRRVGVYPKDSKPYSIKSNFLVYAVGLSPSGKLGVYSSNENSDLQLFNVATGKKIHLLKGQKSIPSTIKFFDEDGFFSAGYGSIIYYWYLKEYKRTEK